MRISNINFATIAWEARYDFWRIVIPASNPVANLIFHEVYNQDNNGGIEMAVDELRNWAADDWGTDAIS